MSFVPQRCIGDSVKRISWAMAFALVANGCAPAAPTLAANGYSRIAIPPGCFGVEHEHNVQLAPELERALTGLLNNPPDGAMCWRERADGSLWLSIGSECGPHREAEFRRGAGTWKLQSETNERLVICDERRR